MYAKKILKLSLIAIILFSNAILIYPATNDDSKNNSRDEEKSLYQMAELKKMIFQWLWEHLKDSKSAERQIEHLRSERLKIKRAVERLEFITKIRNRQKQDEIQNNNLTTEKKDIYEREASEE